ncbi:MAG: nickel transport protein [Desulforhopalus sp.]
MHAKTVIILILFCSLFIAGPCLAHKVRIFAWSEGDTIHTEAKFSGGKAAQNATVTVIEMSTGTELLHGTTDKQGLFQFPVPKTDSAELDIVINSGDGHKNSWRYELDPSPGKTTTLAKQNVAASTVDTEPSKSVTFSEQQLTTLMDNLLEAKLAPIRRQLAEQQEQTPSFQDIIGGIGYILGLAGIAAYMKSKKK